MRHLFKPEQNTNSGLLIVFIGCYYIGKIGIIKNHFFRELLSIVIGCLNNHFYRVLAVDS